MTAKFSKAVLVLMLASASGPAMAQVVFERAETRQGCTADRAIGEHSADKKACKAHRSTPAK